MGYAVKVSPKMDHSTRVKDKDPRIAGINHSEWKIKTREIARCGAVGAPNPREQFHDARAVKRRNEETREEIRRRSVPESPSFP